MRAATTVMLACARPGRRGLARRASVFLSALAVIVAALLAFPQAAKAVPSFARQTGQPCATCHTAYPELTPYGRRFKLSGYTLQGGDSSLPPIAAMVMPTFTHTEAALDPGSQPPGTQTNNNLAVQQVTGFYAGRVYGDLGAFIQVTDSPIGNTNTLFLDATDVRYVKSGTLFGQTAWFGIDVNNTPTVEDVWNTTPAFSFPEISTIFAAFSPPLTHLESGWGQQVAGAGGYMFWNDMFYADLTGYMAIPKSGLMALGEPIGDGLSGVAPYWRLAMEPHWGDNYWEVGTFGMYGQVVPGYVGEFGTDNLLDVGFDSQYQYDGDRYSVTVKLTDIMEWQKLNSSFAQGNSSNLDNRLNSFKANASFVWDHTYSVTAGYFDVSGTSDMGLYGANSFNNSPNGRGLIFDVAYLPFSHGSPWPYSTYNARIGISYTRYLELFGGTNNFDGSGLGGTHNASGNNALFLYAWLAF